jgi:hypothetical protein
LPCRQIEIFHRDLLVGQGKHSEKEGDGKRGGREGGREKFNERREGGREREGEM